MRLARACTSIQIFEERKFHNNSDRTGVMEYLNLASDDVNKGEDERQRLAKALEQWEQELEKFSILDLSSARALMEILDSSPMPALTKQSLKDKIDEKLSMDNPRPVRRGERRGGSYVKQDFKSIHNYFTEDEWLCMANDDESATDTVCSKCMQVQCYYPSATSYTHFVTVIMLCHTNNLTLADAPRGYSLGQKLRSKLGRQRPQQRDAVILVVEYPADPVALYGMNHEAHADLMRNGPFCKCQCKSCLLLLCVCLPNCFHWLSHHFARPSIFLSLYIHVRQRDVHVY